MDRHHAHREALKLAQGLEPCIRGTLKGRIKTSSVPFMAFRIMKHGHGQRPGGIPGGIANPPGMAMTPQREGVVDIDGREKR